MLHSTIYVVFGIRNRHILILIEEEMVNIAGALVAARNPGHGYLARNTFARPQIAETIIIFFDTPVLLKQQLSTSKTVVVIMCELRDELLRRISACSRTVQH